MVKFKDILIVFCNQSLESDDSWKLLKIHLVDRPSKPSRIIQNDYAMICCCTSKNQRGMLRPRFVKIHCRIISKHQDIQIFYRYPLFFCIFAQNMMHILLSIYKFVCGGTDCIGMDGIVGIISKITDTHQPDFMSHIQSSYNQIDRRARQRFIHHIIQYKSKFHVISSLIISKIPKPFLIFSRRFNASSSSRYLGDKGAGCSTFR